MTEILCCTRGCTFNRFGLCKASSITISDGECHDLCLYDELPEYREVFWIATKRKKEKSVYREKRIGKRILVDSYVFYTDEYDRYPDYCYLTEERTGINAGSLSFVRENIQEVMERAAELPDVMDYPERK